MSTRRIPTAELTGRALDWAVAQCEIALWRAYDDAVENDRPTPPRPSEFLCDYQFGPGFSPSTNWAQGGPIIERERIGTSPHEKDGPEAWRAWHMKTMLTGPTALIAAMRCYASKLSAVVDVPEDLA